MPGPRRHRYLARSCRLRAFALFLIVRQMNRLRRLVDGQAMQKAPELPADVALLAEIRDLLKARHF